MFCRDRTGAEVWVVIVKGTFTASADGSVMVADAQQPVSLAPEYRGEPGTSSLRYEADAALGKSRTDVLLDGQAWAPLGRPCSTVDVTMAVGPVRKTLRVFGDRHWRQQLFTTTLSTPAPFTTMPLLYERAFGGVDGSEYEARNPVGVGFLRSQKSCADAPAPNIEDPAQLITSPQDRPRPAGFGPIARHWSPRREHAGTYDSRWQQERSPLWPTDLRDDFFQCAPPDQQVAGFLRGGEPVELCNLTAPGLLRCTLPRIHLAFRTYLGRQLVEHRGHLHTVILEAGGESLRLFMVWQTQLPCQYREHLIERTVIEQKKFV